MKRRQSPLRSHPINGYVEALFGSLEAGQEFRLALPVTSHAWQKSAPDQGTRLLDGAIVNLLPSVRVWVAQEEA